MFCNPLVVLCCRDFASAEATRGANRQSLRLPLVCQIDLGGEVSESEVAVVFVARLHHALHQVICLVRLTILKEIVRDAEAHGDEFEGPKATGKNPARIFG